MTGIGLIIVFILAIALMIFCISKLKIHPFLAIMAISLVFGLIAGIPLVNTTDADGNTVSGIANVIGAGFSGTFSSIGIVIIFGALNSSSHLFLFGSPVASSMYTFFCKAWFMAV